VGDGSNPSAPDDSLSIEISIDEAEGDPTPLPRAIPFHVAEPTSESAGGLVAEPSDLPVAEDAETRPGNADGTHRGLSGIASAARLISASLGLAGDDDDPDAAIVTQRMQRIAPAQRIVDDLDEDALLTPPMITLPIERPSEDVLEPAGRIASQEVIAGRFFAPLPAERRGPVLDRFTRRMVSAGTTVIRQGELNHPLVLVASGRLEVRAELATGELVDVTAIAAGEFVGEAALLARAPAPAHVVAAVDSELLELAARDLYELAGAFPALWAELKDVAERRTREHDRRVKKR